MTLKEAKTKALAMIEELNQNSSALTSDPDIAAKINEVMNQVMFELARIKKIPQYVELPVEAGAMVTFADIEQACGRRVYQLGTVGGVSYVSKASGTKLKILESGTAEIDFFVYPNRITTENEEGYVFELSDDALEIMPYGVAAHLLLSDVSAEYGAVYSKEYEKMLSRLDPRYQMNSVTFEGGVNI